MFGRISSCFSLLFVFAPLMAIAAEITDGSFVGAYDVTVPSASAKNKITASSASNSGPANAFDNTCKNRYLDQHTSYWVCYQFKNGLSPKLCAYGILMPTISYDNVNRAPKDWTFEGSNDGSAWTVLDTETNVSGWQKGVWRYFSCDDTNGYTYFRINCTANNGDNYVSLSQVEFYTRDVSVNVVGEPANYGTAAGITYGLDELLDRGTVKTYSVASNLTVDDEDSSIHYVPVSDGVRAVYKGYRFTDAAGVMTDSLDESLMRTLAGVKQNQLIWKWQLRNRTIASAGAGGKVKLGSRDVAQSAFLWIYDDASVTLQAIPDEGYKFDSWSGDLPDPSLANDATITVTGSIKRNLTATFKEAQHKATTLYLQPTSTLVGWDDSAAAWGGKAPGDGDTLILTNLAKATTLTLTHDTPPLAMLDIGANVTLVVSNWQSRVMATNIVIRNGGAIASVGSYTEEAMSNRVWIVGNTLDVQAGGKVCADAAGYAARKGPGWRLSSNPNGVDYDGGAYGGRQNYLWRLGDCKTYGSAECPEDPGTGGSGTAGGGAIRLDLTGALTVNGAITANGAKGYSLVANGGGGSGGGVMITCASIVGNGKVTANAIDYTSGSGAGGAGGGRVAVHYDAAAQTAAGACGVRFETRGSSVRDNGSSNHNIYDGECGTLWFTDGRFLETSPVRLAGVWSSPLPDGVAVSAAGDFVYENCWLQVMNATTTYEVGGNLVVTGAYCKLNGVLVTNSTMTVGGDIYVRGATLETWSPAVTVGGNVTLEAVKANNLRTCGDLCVWAQPTNGTSRAVGCVFNVAGDVSVGTKCSYKPGVHPDDGAIVKLGCSKLSLVSGGWIDASRRGWASTKGPGRFTGGEGLGVGSSYGGLGGTKGDTPKPCYGSERMPLDPGSGAGQNTSSWGPGYAGGGVVAIAVAGDMTINGEVKADACESGYTPDYYISNGGSGGAIYLTCGRLKGTTGAFSAQGGTASAGGGGGRIAVRYRRNGSTLSAASCNVDGAKNNKGNGAAANGQPGTVFWRPMPGMAIILR